MQNKWRPCLFSIFDDFWSISIKIKNHLQINVLPLSLISWSWFSIEFCFVDEDQDHLCLNFLGKHDKNGIIHWWHHTVWRQIGPLHGFRGKNFHFCGVLLISIYLRAKFWFPSCFRCSLSALLSSRGTSNCVWTDIVNDPANNLQWVSVRDLVKTTVCQSVLPKKIFLRTENLHISTKSDAYHIKL